MARNPLAEAANAAIAADCPQVLDLLGETGKSLYFPKGILTQSAEAKTRATRYNATIGIATEGGVPMHLDSVAASFDDDLSPAQLYPYAPSTGVPALREAWAARQRQVTPSLGDHPTSLPVVTNALTHALTVTGQLFLDPGQDVLVADKLWGNYRLGWEVMQGATIRTFPLFDESLSGFNVAALTEALAARRGHKQVVALNFPNNPTGYQPTKDEANAIVAALTAEAEAGTPLVVVLDDAYYGMFFEAECETESLFGRLAQAHENLLAVKIDGATKEAFVWGLRVGFITFGIKHGTEAVYQALAAKAGGAIRGAISNVTMPGQSVVLRALQQPDFEAQVAAKVAILEQRVIAVRAAADDQQYADCWQVYPFNAGYFMCLRLIDAEAEAVRVHLLDEHQTGAIALGNTDLRVAFSCVEASDIPDLFDRIAQAVRAVRAD